MKALTIRLVPKKTDSARFSKKCGGCKACTGKSCKK